MPNVRLQSVRLPPEKLHKILCGFPSCLSFSTLLSVSPQGYRRVAACLWLELSVLLSQLARCHQCPRFRTVKTCVMLKTTDLDPPHTSPIHFLYCLLFLKDVWASQTRLPSVFYSVEGRRAHRKVGHGDTLKVGQE